MNLTDIQLDALRETVSIGAGNAATALSDFAKRAIRTQVPVVKVLTLDQLEPALAKRWPGQTRVIVRVGVLGAAPGTILITSSAESAAALADVLLERHHAPGKGLDPMGLSALQETANILAAHYLTALSKFLGMDLRPSVPYVAVDPRGNILSGTIDEIRTMATHAVVIETELSEAKRQLVLQFTLVPSPKALDGILHALGVKGK